jgi:hypothetical protein
MHLFVFKSARLANAERNLATVIMPYHWVIEPERTRDTVLWVEVYYTLECK